PHGGNQMSLAIAAGLRLGGAESYPGGFGPFGGFADDAEGGDGFITLSKRPRNGFEGEAAVEKMMGQLFVEGGERGNPPPSPPPFAAENGEGLRPSRHCCPHDALAITDEDVYYITYIYTHNRRNAADAYEYRNR